MTLNYLIKKSGKILVKGILFRAGKRLAKNGGKIGIGAGALLAGGFLAHEMLKEREKEKTERKPANKITTSKKQIVV